jgi:hypothetical protein
MLRNEQLLHREPTLKVPALTEKTAVATILIVFLFLHLFAAAVLQRAGAEVDGSSEHNKALQLYD